MKEIFKMISTNKMYDMMLNLYSSLPIDNSSYKKLVDIIKNEDDIRFLSHRTSGKDRTGVGTAIIYMILGVDIDTIIKDYLDSNIYAKNKIEEMINKYPHLKEIPYDYLNNMLGVNINYLMEVFKVIDSKYNSDEDYLIGEFGLTKDDINKIRDYCLE